jgi:TetR/AcrR family transcriptional repressor of nem operon
MSEIITSILDAGERRIRDAGYTGFSFRDIAKDVGVTSASVHYHFPTKERLAAAVSRRYTDRLLAAVASSRADNVSAIESWRRLFRKALVEDGRMCLCGALGASARDLPEEVLSEVRRFFNLGVKRMTEAGIARSDALKLFATLEGAIMMANVLGSHDVFDEATA